MHTNLVPSLSPSFSVIAERFRRAGQPAQAVALCREGLAAYPEHLSARVTLGCSLLELGQDGEAQRELQAVLKRAPDNLAAIRGLAELHARGVEELVDEVTEPVDEVVMATLGEPQHQFEAAAPAAESALVVELEAPQPVMFEIEDVIDAADDDRSRDFDFDFLDADLPAASDSSAPASSTSASTSAPMHGPVPVPVPTVSEGTVAVLDEWLSRVRARKAELLSQYAAG